MKTITLVMAAASVAFSTLALAEQPADDADREQRMNDALQNYRDKQDNRPGPMARAEDSIKSGARKTGHAIERGAKKVGHAIGTGMHKTGEAIHHAGEKVQDKTTDK